NSNPRTPTTAAVIDMNEPGMKVTRGFPFSSTRSTSAIAVVTDIRIASRARYENIHACTKDVHFWTDVFVSFAILPTPNISTSASINTNAHGWLAAASTAIQGFN